MTHNSMKEILEFALNTFSPVPLCK